MALVSNRLQAVLEAIDDANGEDPARREFEGQQWPLSLVEGRRAYHWVTEICREAPSDAAPSEALLIAARGHHIRRWEVPRSSQPAGRDGYLAWRSGLYEVHAAHLAQLMRAASYPDEDIEAMTRLMHRRAIKTDPEAQLFQDAVSLAFLEIQFPAFAQRAEREVAVRAVRRTWRKMSEAGRTAALGLPLPPALGEVVREALDGPAGDARGSGA
jgi:hypothetical protein